MKKHIALLLLVLVTATGTFAQKVGPYKITGIRIMPFDGNTGKFEDELAVDGRGGYFNDLDKAILAIIEITGPAGQYADKRGVSIRVTEGKKVKLSKIDYPGVMNENGKFYLPVFLYSAMCDQVTITATMTGQTQKSSMKRQLDFMCGE
jgi:hypothetical protein